MLELEKKVIGNAPRIKNGNMTQPPFLRISRRILTCRLEKYGICRGGSLLLKTGGEEYSSVD